MKRPVYLFLIGGAEKNDFMKAFERLAKFTYLGMTNMSAGSSRDDTEKKKNQ
jgi:hypothetical protein